MNGEHSFKFNTTIDNTDTYRRDYVLNPHIFSYNVKGVVVSVWAMFILYLAFVGILSQQKTLTSTINNVTGRLNKYFLLSSSSR